METTEIWPLGPLPLRLPFPSTCGLVQLGCSLLKYLIYGLSSPWTTTTTTLARGESLETFSRRTLSRCVNDMIFSVVFFFMESELIFLLALQCRDEEESGSPQEQCQHVEWAHHWLHLLPLLIRRLLLLLSCYQEEQKGYDNTWFCPGSTAVYRYFNLIDTSPPISLFTLTPHSCSLFSRNFLFPLPPLSSSLPLSLPPSLSLSSSLLPLRSLSSFSPPQNKIITLYVKLILLIC
jgi:hypothetical protein